MKSLLNPYLRHFGNVMERHLWTKNPQSHFWFWWRHTWIKFFDFMLIWNLLIGTNCMPLSLITWRHYSEISYDEHKCTRKPGNMVERHSWTKNPQLFFSKKWTWKIKTSFQVWIHVDYAFIFIFPNMFW